MDFKIYVSTYKKYNEGSLKGDWVTITPDYDLFIEEIEKLHEDEDSPEFMFQDYDFESDAVATIFNSLGETPDIEEICRGLELLENENLEMIAAYIDNCGCDDIEDAINKANECFVGEYKGDEDFAYSLAEDTGAINKDVSWPYTCIDWAHAAREIMYDHFESNGFYFINY